MKPPLSFLDRRRPGRKAGRALLVLVLAVLAAHALFIGGFDSFAQVVPASSYEAVQSVLVAPPVEDVVAAAPAHVLDPPPVIEPAPPVAAAVHPRTAPVAKRHRPVPKATAPIPVEASVAEASPPVPAEPAEAAAASMPEEPASAPPAPAEATSEAAADAPVVLAAAASVAPATPPSAAAAEPAASQAVAAVMPVYPTSIPPAFSFVYDLSRSPLTGNGSLVLRFTDEGYEAHLQGSVAGFNVLEWVSTGAVDDTGFAPVRFTEQRLRRAMTAANFQRALGRITYSSSSDSVPLPAGAQDRLSWMLQLAAIAHKHPEKLIPGDHITMFVSGVRADAEAWTFTVIGTEDVRTPFGVINATVHLLREPRMPHDTRADVWLDPSRHHLPARARLSNNDDGSDAFELKLREAPDSLP